GVPIARDDGDGARSRRLSSLSLKNLVDGIDLALHHPDVAANAAVAIQLQDDAVDAWVGRPFGVGLFRRYPAVNNDRCAIRHGADVDQTFAVRDSISPGKAIQEVWAAPALRAQALTQQHRRETRGLPFLEVNSGRRIPVALLANRDPMLTLLEDDLRRRGLA